MIVDNVIIYFLRSQTERETACVYTSNMCRSFVSMVIGRARARWLCESRAEQKEGRVY